MHTRVRRAEPGDVERLIELSLRTIRATYTSFLAEAAVEAFTGSGAVDEFVRETADRALVVTLDDEVVGYAVGKGDHIDQLMVDVRFQQRGLGTQLLSQLESELFKDHDVLVLESFRDNHQANAFYRKHGWKVTGAYRDENNGVEMIKLRKEAHRPK